MEKKVRYSPPDFPKNELSDEATRARRNLIAVIAIWTLIVPLGMLPKKIALFEIDLVNVPVSVPDLISAAVVYFWISYIIYGYRDFVRWVDAVSNAVSAQREKIIHISMDIEDGIKAVESAKNANEPGASILFRSTGNRIGYPLTSMDRYLNDWRLSRKHHRRRYRQLWTDIALRSLWDYGVPAGLLAFPVWHFCR